MSLVYSQFKNYLEIGKDLWGGTLPSFNFSGPTNVKDSSLSVLAQKLSSTPILVVPRFVPTVQVPGADFPVPCRDEGLNKDSNVHDKVSASVALFHDEKVVFLTNEW